MENAYEGVVVTDSEGIIMMFNAAYANYLEIRSQDAIGQHVTKVIDNTRVHEVVKSGVPEFGKLQKIGSHKAVVTRLPITFNKKVIAGVGIVHYRELTDMKRLVEKLSSLESELAQIKEEYGKNQVKRYSIQDIIGNSRPIMDLKKQIHKAAASSSTVLILGRKRNRQGIGSSFPSSVKRPERQTVCENQLCGYTGGNIGIGTVWLCGWRIYRKQSGRQTRKI